MSKQDPLKVGDYLINKYSRNIVIIKGRIGNLYVGQIVEPGPNHTPSESTFKIGNSWWNFYNRWPEQE